MRARSWHVRARDGGGRCAGGGGVPARGPWGVGHSWHHSSSAPGTSDAADVVVSKVRAVGRSVTGPVAGSLGERGSGARSLAVASGRRPAHRRFERARPSVADAAAMLRVGGRGRHRARAAGFFADHLRRERRCRRCRRSAMSPTQRTRLAPRSARRFIDRLRRSTTPPRRRRRRKRHNTLPAHRRRDPWFIDQTVVERGGEPATHELLAAPSLSSQVVAVSVVLANGTVAEFRESVTPPRTSSTRRGPAWGAWASSSTSK